ncbi:MAG: sulfate ABC transporter permease subunit CysT [Gemmatimonadetes bacterium]|nr:MAG: sulfate ABC transporter permease subunit CysT [Gemmatimonadota bacterium]
MTPALPRRSATSARTTPRVRSVLPGVRLTLGFTLAYLLFLVIIPLSTLFVRTARLGWSGFLEAATSPRAIAAYKLSVGTSVTAAVVNGVFGLLVAWVLTRYRFTGKSIADALVDLPFALPTAVAGVALTTLYAQNGLIGALFAPHGIKIAFTPLGITVALTFIGLPFVVRSVQPVLETLPKEIEEVAATLGADRWQTFRRVILPALTPALVAGVSLSFARAIGEYGSVVFISGNMPGRTEIAPLLIMSKLEQYDYSGATAIAVVMLLLSAVILISAGLVQRRAARRAA